ncbi:MAG: MFS transporter [Clostridia bacterium]|nr:MFS transporter [Clostridia bacterium]MBP5767020.1 MFS transporter [Clostridia bacterium]
MKLNYKRTILVGFAFFLICVFWQAYDNTVPLILTNKFGMSQTWSGVIMALDNILALFLLPLFGSLSDKVKTKSGRRTPFIMIGTILAAVLFVGLSVVDARQLTKVENVTPDKYESSLSVIYDANPEVSVKEKASDGKTLAEALKHLFAEAKKLPLQEIYPEKSDFMAIKMYKTDENGAETTTLSDDYTDYVVPARNAYAWQQTAKSPLTLIFFVVLLLGTLVSMGIFRSPAVALMPDVTPKPLRSKANAIINLMGSFGGITVLVLGMIFKTSSAKNALMNYIPFFATVAGIMIIALIVFRLTVKEPAWALDAQRLEEIEEAEEKKEDGATASEEVAKAAEQTGKLSKAELRSLIFLLLSVALWYMGYNAVTSKYSVYATSVLDMDYNMTLIIAQAAAILSYIPIGIISTKLGRKKTILAGVVMLGVAFGAAAFMRAGSPVWFMNILFALAGIGWATINVNSFPMVVELAAGNTVGKYTGYYYTASMAAQVITPILSGIFLDIRFTTLFPYATVFVALAFITMLFVKHGDHKPLKKKSVIENFDVDD